MDIGAMQNPSPIFRLLRCERCGHASQTREGKAQHQRTAHAGRRSA